MFRLFESFLSLPAPVIALVICALWALVALAVHRLVVPWLCGRDGRKLVRFESEVTSQIALAFGLLLSFNAVWLWDRSDRVQSAVIEEAAAMQALLDDADLLDDATQASAVRVAVRDHARYIADTEWPTLADSSTDPSRPETAVVLRKVAHSAGGAPLLDIVKAAEAARDTRIRAGLASMSSARWGVVLILGILLVVSIGALHGECPRSRKLALTLVTLAIGFCFSVLLVHARPFVGEYAIKPDALRAVAERAVAP
ncbi:MAG: DUF4239 domain-containing protein [Planctomycetaceae bacterium]|jgi:hypothetical protein|nr:DUF4239 domain-containing protein [Planctomycetaceae bacterium]